MGVLEDLDRARETYERGDWGAAFDRWSSLDPVTLSADDLVAMATTAELLDRRDDAADALQRAYRLNLDAGDTRAAARCACELGDAVLDLRRAGHGRRLGGPGRAAARRAG